MEPTCPQCRTPLEGTGPLKGLCQRCLLGGVHRPTVADAAPPPPPGHTTLSAELPQLDIVELIGRGGMGIVYKARQRRLDRLVALKVLAPELGEREDFAERFLREARVLARLDHPGVVGVHDFGEAGGLYYLVLEYVDGTSLRELMSRDVKLTAAEALAIVPQICEGLTYAHEMGVVHRDIKPENILVDRSGRVKIADFGLAKMVGAGSERSALTRASQVMGTPQYMAPEQLTGTRDVDHRADIFSLGVVLYEMLTGDLPVGRFEPPSKSLHVDVRLDEVVLRALEREPDKRYQHASDVRTDLEGLNGDGELPARAAPRRPEPSDDPDALVPGVDYPAFLRRLPVDPWKVMDWGVLAGIAWLIVLSLQDLGRSTELLAGAYPLAILSIFGRHIPRRAGWGPWSRALLLGIGFVTCVAAVVMLSTRHYSFQVVFLKAVAGTLVVLSHCGLERFIRRGERGILPVSGVLLLIAAVVHGSLHASTRPAEEALGYFSGFLSLMMMASSLILAAEYLVPPVPERTLEKLARVLVIGLPAVAVYFLPVLA